MNSVKGSMWKRKGTQNDKMNKDRSFSRAISGDAKAEVVMRLLLSVSSPKQDLDSLPAEEKEQLSGTISLLKKHVKNLRHRKSARSPVSAPVLTATTSESSEQIDGDALRLAVTTTERDARVGGMCAHSHVRNKDSGYFSVSDEPGACLSPTGDSLHPPIPEETEEEGAGMLTGSSSVTAANHSVTAANRSVPHHSPELLHGQVLDSMLGMLHSEHDGPIKTLPHSHNLADKSSDDVFSKSFEKENGRLCDGCSELSSQGTLLGHQHSFESPPIMSGDSHMPGRFSELTCEELELAETEEELVYLRDLKCRYQEEFADNMEFKEIMRSLGRPPSVTDYMTFKIKLVRDKYGQDYETPISHAFSLLMDDSGKAGPVSYAAFASAVEPLVRTAQKVTDVPFLLGVLGGYVMEALPQAGDAVLTYSSQLLGQRMAGGVAGGVAKLVGASVLPSNEDCSEFDGIIDVLTRDGESSKEAPGLVTIIKPSHPKLPAPPEQGSGQDSDQVQNQDWNQGQDPSGTRNEATNHARSPKLTTSGNKRWFSVSVLTFAAQIASVLESIN